MPAKIKQQQRGMKVRHRVYHRSRSLLQLLGSDLLYQNQVTAPGEFTTVVDGAITELADWTGQGADLTPNAGNGGVLFAADGGPNDQPYAYSNEETLDFLEGEIETIPAASRVEFYVVMRPGVGGVPIEISHSGNVYPFACSCDANVFLYAHPTAAALQDLNVGAAGSWALYSVGYLASGLVACINGVATDPNFTGNGTCRGNNPCTYWLVAGGVDAVAFSCAVLDPTDAKRAIVAAYVNNLYDLGVDFS